MNLKPKMAMKDKLEDFIQAWRKYDRDGDKTHTNLTGVWSGRLHDAGYYSVDISGKVPFPYSKAQQWCIDTIGKGRYCFLTNHSFWFENERDAMLFTLRWL